MNDNHVLVVFVIFACEIDMIVISISLLQFENTPKAFANLSPEFEAQREAWVTNKIFY